MQRHSPNLFHLLSFYSCGGGGMFNMGLYLSDSVLFVFFRYSPKSGKALDKKLHRAKVSRRNLGWVLLEIMFIGPQLSLGEK